MLVIKTFLEINNNKTKTFCNIDLLVQKRIEHFQSITFICYCNENDQELKYFAKNIWLCKKKKKKKKIISKKCCCFAENRHFQCGFFAFSRKTLNSGIFKLYMDEEKKFMLNLFL